MDNRDSDFILDLRFFNSLLGPAEPPVVMTMDGIIITIGETSQRKPPFSFEPICLSCAWAIRKSRQGFPRRLVPLRFTERCAASSGARTRCLFLFGRTASIRRRVLCQYVEPTIPDVLHVLLALTLIKPALLSYRPTD